MLLNKKLYYSVNGDYVTTSPSYTIENGKVNTEALLIKADSKVMQSLWYLVPFSDIIHTPEFLQYAQIVSKHIRNYRHGKSFIPTEVEQGLLQEFILYAFENVAAIEELQSYQSIEWHEVHRLMYRALNSLAQRQTTKEVQNNRVSLDSQAQDNEGAKYDNLSNLASMEAYILSTRHLEQADLLKQFDRHAKQLLTQSEIDNLNDIFRIKEEQSKMNRKYWAEEGLLITNAHRASRARAQKKLQLLPKEFINQLLS